MGFNDKYDHMNVVQKLKAYFSKTSKKKPNYFFTRTKKNILYTICNTIYIIGNMWGTRI